jgi:hypothetical protein
MRTSPAVLVTFIFSVWASGCGGSGATGPVVSVSPGTLTVSTGDGATSFAAVLSNGAIAPVTWTLTGAGSISTTSGAQTSYQPPPLGSTAGTATLRASAGCGPGCAPVGDNAAITINTATTGTLTISVQLQSSTAASLTVTGPNGFSQVVTTTSTTTLTGLAPGSYTVTAAPVIDNTSTIVTSQYSAPPVSATVAANAAATATVTYASEPGYGMMWITGVSANTVDGFTAGDLTINNAPSITPTTGGAVQGIAFDTTGNMWASIKGPDSVVGYAAAGLANSEALTPTVTLTDAHISDPAGLAFGPDARLWVANCATNSITAFPRAGGSVSVVITSNTGLLNCPRGIAFDTAGNLWVTNAGGVAERFPNAQIATTNNAPVADVTLTPPTSPASTQPYGIALDANGNVWVSFCAGSTVARYNASGSSVTATPAATLTPTGVPVSLSCPVALALDNSGQLWVANKGTPGAGTLSQFGLADMATGGAATPLTQLPGLGVTVGGMAFNPTATNLPIRH